MQIRKGGKNIFTMLLYSQIIVLFKQKIRKNQDKQKQTNKTSQNE